MAAYQEWEEHHSIMASYKVIQDVESEDKLVGPLTLRQFIYAGIAALNFYLSFLVISKGAAFVAAIFGPIGLVSAFFAWPWSRDQPTEVWALARVKFLVVPRKRIWDQSGMKELVTITAPKKIERTLTNGLTQNEVRSRLRALADTIDSRGWAIKNVNVSMLGQPALVGNDDGSDRLVGMSTLPQPVDITDVKDSEDMLDVQNNPVAQQFDSMIAASERAHRQDIINKMQAVNNTPVPAPTPPPQQPMAMPKPPTPPQPKLKPVQAPTQNDYWFLNQPTQQASVVPQNAVTFNTQVVAPGTPASNLPVAAANPTADEETFIKSHKNEPPFSPNMHGHLHVIQPISAQNAQQAAMASQNGTASAQDNTGQDADAVSQQNVANLKAAKMTQRRDAGILDLARNDDLNVATIAREAQKRQEPPEDEVVISLH